MMVIFTSLSEKKALLTTRRILDSFADRIGHDTWRTVITKEGLLTVKELLRRQATKSTAVACHWIRSRHHSELLWVVGNRDKFDATGCVPVHTTAKNLLHREWEGGWPYMPLLKALTAMAALLHDWGKASKHFQKKLRKSQAKEGKSADPLRHEWISVKLIEALVAVGGDTADDKAWLSYLLSDKVEEKALLDELSVIASSPKGDKFPAKLPPLAQMIAWLILSHHRLPVLWDKNERTFYADGGAGGETFSAMLQALAAHWGYANGDPEKKKDCFSFPQGLLFADPLWKKSITKWAARLLAEKATAEGLLAQGAAGVATSDGERDASAAAEKSLALRPLLLYARTALLLGDHYMSSLPGAASSDKKLLLANTDGGQPKQTLAEHLVGVMKEAVQIVHCLPAFATEMGKVTDLRLPRAKDPAFFWQDKAVQAIRDEKAGENAAWFIVNMASTGCGKTFANAKLMQAIAPDGKSLRYILALGLRALTLQTGTEYRTRMGIGADEFAVLIGSSTIQKLYDEAQKGNAETQEDAAEDFGSREEALLPGALDFQDDLGPEQMKFLNQFFASSQKKGKRASRKNHAFLYKPVLALTIDHIMGAVESLRGGRHLLPFLRLMSSNLVIDEIDDFVPGDLTAIARLVHLAGILGRSVVISSATIPPDLAEGMYRAWQDGLAAGNSFFAAPKKPYAAWVDEFSAAATSMPLTGDEFYREKHGAFVKKRVKALRAARILRKARIVDFAREEWEPLKTPTRLDLYFDKMYEAALRLHADNHIIDEATGKRVSFGLIRLANVEPCVYACQRFMKTPDRDGFALRFMCYHSRQVLLLRHEQECYLDRALKRHGENSAAARIEDPVLRAHIDESAANDILFIVVATPVEEIGRDHDFDWAVIEPSSYRSIIQLVGRLLRHRKRDKDIERPNLAIMPYNLRSLRFGDERPVFCYPGFETKNVKLDSHDLRKIVDEAALADRIDAVPRIQRPEKLEETKRLVDLEHYVLAKWQSPQKGGPKTPIGWQREFWWLTGLPQQFNRFRSSAGEDVRRFYVYDVEKSRALEFYARDEQGNFILLGSGTGIQPFSLPTAMAERLWLKRDYLKALQDHLPSDSEDEDEALKKLSQFVGEISWQELGDALTHYFYCDQLGLFKRDWEKFSCGEKVGNH